MQQLKQVFVIMVMLGAVLADLAAVIATMLLFMTYSGLIPA